MNKDILLFYIFESSVDTGIFPNALKLAKITPIFKADDKTLLK